MDTRTARTTSNDLTPATPHTRLEMRWRLRPTPGRVDTLMAEWVEVEPTQAQQMAA